VHKRRLWKKIPYEPKGQQLRMNPPHEIRDLLPYEPERQQLRMNSPHMLTEHLQRHNLHTIRKRHHQRCKTPMRIRTPKSAKHSASSSNFADSGS
jgi:hypothetical protein